MNIVIIDDMTGIHVYKAWRDLKKVHTFEKNEFAKIGNDYVLNTTGDTFEISKDIKMLEHAASRQVFKKHGLDSKMVITVVMFVLVILTYFATSSISTISKTSNASLIEMNVKISDVEKKFTDIEKKLGELSGTKANR